ncbi:hypothetical protein [Brevibacillus laterosporus]|uniref:hypothetical protein n=1 Tax=Brevibacillus laterosporus TaxID=1465 RepID=UPI002E1BDA7D
MSGQTVTERLNEVLGVGFWKYRGLFDTEKIVQEPNGKNIRIKIYVEFSFYNHELQEWITLIDVGSEQIKTGMNEGDATKSAITDGMKKCASRIGVASDLYKGLITWDKQRQQILIPDSYLAYYKQMGWLQEEKSEPASSSAKSASTKRNDNLTQRLKNKPSSLQLQIQYVWREVAGSLDGFEEWHQKKLSENVTDQQIFNLLQKRLSEKRQGTSA